MPKYKNYKNRCLSALGEPTRDLSAVEQLTSCVASDLEHAFLTDVTCRCQKD